jgi:hypothetical protein
MSDSFLTTSLIIVGLCFLALIVVGTLAIKSIGRKQKQKKSIGGFQNPKSTYSTAEVKEVPDMEFAHNPT